VAIGLNGESGLGSRGWRGRGRLGNIIGKRLFDGWCERGNWRRNGSGRDDGGDGRGRSGLTCRSHCLGRLRDRSGLRLGDGDGRLRKGIGIVSLNRFLFEKTEDVVENKVTVGLLGEEKSLDKLAPRLAAI